MFHAIHSSLEYLRTVIEHGELSFGEGHGPGVSQRQSRMFGALLRPAGDSRGTEWLTVRTLLV